MQDLIESVLVFGLALIIVNLTQWLIRRRCSYVDKKRTDQRRKQQAYKANVENKSRSRL